MSAPGAIQGGDVKNAAGNAEPSAAFTPGPWSVMWQNSRARDYGDWKSWETPVQVGSRANAGNVICTVTMGGPGAGQSDRVTVEANARLVAASPEIYEAAKDVVARWDSPRWKWDESTAALVHRLRAALAKAEAQT